MTTWVASITAIVDAQHGAKLAMQLCVGVDFFQYWFVPFFGGWIFKDTKVSLGSSRATLVSRWGCSLLIYQFNFKRLIEVPILPALMAVERTWVVPVLRKIT